MKSLKHGVGVYNKGVYSGFVGGKITKEHSLWSNMLLRCYSEEYKVRQPTYVGCSVSENFRYYQFFAEWCNRQQGFGLKDYDLDKDILLRGNKIYCEDLCVFIPRQLNRFLAKREADRGDCPIGVYFSNHAGKYIARLTIDNKMYHLGMFDDPELAFRCYKKAKESEIKSKTEKYKDLIDPRVYTALMKYEVNIED